MRTSSLLSTLVFVILGFAICFSGDETTHKPMDEETPQQPSYTKEGRLKDVVITGEDKQKLTSKKPPLELELDINDVVSSYMETERDFLFKTHLPHFPIEPKTSWLSSNQVASPYLMDLVREPVAVFRPKVERGELISSWSLVITDHKGRVFKGYTGTGEPPEVIVWDGRSDKGEFANPGNTYTYVFKYVDVVANRHTVIGEPFNFKGLVHQERKGLVISLSPKVLFDEDGTTIKEGGLPLLYETSDEIKAHFGLPIKVEAYCGDVSIATKQADAVACVLSDRLNTPRARIKTSGYKTPRERQRVDVIILNR